MEVEEAGTAPGTAFDADTRLEELGGGRYRIGLDPRWNAPPGPNGGFIAALVVRAIEATVADPARPPRSLTIHYLRPPKSLPDGPPLEIEVTVEREGRSLSSASVRISQTGVVTALALAACSAPREGIDFDQTQMPDVPAPADCPDIPYEPGRTIELISQIEMRLAAGAPFTGAPEARSACWMRLREPRRPDAALLALAVDAWLPAIFTLTTEIVAAPTIDLTIHWRSPVPAALAPDDYLLVSVGSRLGRDGFWEEDADVWAPDGTLLAQGRQIALALPLRGPDARG